MGRPVPQELAFVTAPAQLVGDRALRRFLSSISHELGNSVMPLRTAAVLLAERFNDPELRARFGEIVQTDSRRIEEVLARLLRFASFGPPARSALDLSELLDALVDEQRPELETRQVLLLRELERDQPHVLGDPAQIRFGLEALLRRALQLVKVRGDLYLASRFHPHGLRGAPSIRMLLRFRTAARILPVGSAEGASLSETALDLLLTEAIARAHGGRFTLDAGESMETVVLIDLPAPASVPQGSGKIAVA
jgi:signal transduction histidine kinase